MRLLTTWKHRSTRYSLSLLGCCSRSRRRAAAAPNLAQARVRRPTQRVEARQPAFHRILTARTLAPRLARPRIRVSHRAVLAQARPRFRARGLAARRRRLAPPAQRPRRAPYAAAVTSAREGCTSVGKCGVRAKYGRRTASRVRVWTGVRQKRGVLRSSPAPAARATGLTAAWGWSRACPCAHPADRPPFPGTLAGEYFAHCRSFSAANTGASARRRPATPGRHRPNRKGAIAAKTAVGASPRQSPP